VRAAEPTAPTAPMSMASTTHTLLRTSMMVSVGGAVRSAICASVERNQLSVS
jgi:hypothetical protein